MHPSTFNARSNRNPQPHPPRIPSCNACLSAFLSSAELYCSLVFVFLLSLLWMYNIILQLQVVLLKDYREKRGMAHAPAVRVTPQHAVCKISILSLPTGEGTRRCACEYSHAGCQPAGAHAKPNASLQDLRLRKLPSSFPK
jgi:hypothetical protein